MCDYTRVEVCVNTCHHMHTCVAGAKAAPNCGRAPGHLRTGDSARTVSPDGTGARPAERGLMSSAAPLPQSAEEDSRSRRRLCRWALGLDACSPGLPASGLVSLPGARSEKMRCGHSSKPPGPCIGSRRPAPRPITPPPPALEGSTPASPASAPHA